MTKPEDVGLSSERLARVNAWAQRGVDERKLPGLITMVARHGKLVHCNVCGMADIKREVRLAPDTIFRFYSMTKPLTSTAIMMLYEEGRFQLDDPITRFLPCFKDMRVYVGGMRGKLETVPAERDITFRDLLTHTSGLPMGSWRPRRSMRSTANGAWISRPRTRAWPRWWRSRLTFH
ncbi:MAG TPA: serine hydrolase domain-containing protein [Acetobacteraceae bacterium]